VRKNCWNIWAACDFLQTNILAHLCKVTFCHLPQMLSSGHENEHLLNFLTQLTNNLVCHLAIYSMVNPLIASRIAIQSKSPPF
jgi:uncharacterized membrane protein affecting hemolysin expression